MSGGMFPIPMVYPSGGGGNDPATGTLLVGTDTHLGTAYNLNPPSVIVGPVFVATTSGTAHTAELFEGTWDGEYAKILVFDVDDNLLTDSEEKAIIDGLQTFNLTTPIAIVAGNSYRIGVYADNYIVLGTNGTGNTLEYSQTESYPTSPSAFVGAGNHTPDTIHVNLRQ